MFAAVQQGRCNFSRYLKIKTFYLQNLNIHLSGDRHFSQDKYDDCEKKSQIQLNWKEYSKAYSTYHYFLTLMIHASDLTIIIN